MAVRTKKAAGKGAAGRAGPGKGGVDVRERILAVAAARFAAHGYAGVSIRDVTRAAGVQIAALYHYFPSKAALLHEVLAWALAPVQAQRAEAMLALPPDAPLRAVVAVFIAPPLRHAASRSHGKLVRQLAASIANDPTPEVRAALSSVYDRTVRDFIARLQQGAPDVDEGPFRWAMVCIFAITLYLQGDLGRIAKLLGHRLDDDPEQVIDWVTRFVEGGLRGLGKST